MSRESFRSDVKRYFVEHPEVKPVAGAWQAEGGRGCCAITAAYLAATGHQTRPTVHTMRSELRHRHGLSNEYLSGVADGWDHELDPGESEIEERDWGVKDGIALAAELGAIDIAGFFPEKSDVL